MASRRFLYSFKYLVKVHHPRKHNSLLLTRNFGCLSSYEPRSINHSASFALLNVNQTRNYAKGKAKVKSSGSFCLY